VKRLGPGLITGASDDDPSGIGTYSQAGAQLGFGIGWTMLLSYPLMVAIQEISGRIGRVTGHGIAGNVCRNYPSWVVWSLVGLLFIANTINLAADLGAMADAANLGDRRIGDCLRCCLCCHLGPGRRSSSLQTLCRDAQMADDGAFCLRDRAGGR
jgi:hypothetical protein